MRLRMKCVVAVVLAWGVAAVAQKPAPLVIISIDGMKPEYVTHAAEHGLKVPELRTFLTAGTYAEGVTGVVPTVTYPSHTTLVTGVWPAEHGIVDNTVFDPLGEHPNLWYLNWKDIKVQTLYGAAGSAGLETAAVGWPVTVGAPIDYLIAEYAQSEKSDWPAKGIHHPEDIEAQLGISPDVPKQTAAEQDVTKTAQSVAILQKFHPDLMLIHLANLDEEEHDHGPFSTEANAAIEVLDAQVAEIEHAALKANHHTRIAIVSDHGFQRTEKRVNLNIVFEQAGLITLPRGANKKTAITDWQAEAWPAGGANAIIVKGDDPGVIAKTRQVLLGIKANPYYGIDHVLEHDELVKRGGFPEAAFFVDFKEPFSPGGAVAGPVVTPHPHTGTHGFLPDDPQMRSTFMIKGNGIAKARDLNVIDMRQIAPTFAALLNVTLPAAKQPALNVK